MDLIKLKKLGNRIYSLSVKISECEKAGMKTRIPGYIKKLQETKKELNLEAENLKKTYL